MSIYDATLNEAKGLIDPLYNLKKTPVFIHSSAEDDDFHYIKQLNQK